MSEVASEIASEVPAAAAPRSAPNVSVRLHLREEVPLQVKAREERGKGPVGRLRREESMLPGVLYGHKLEAISFKIDRHTIERALSKGVQHAVFLVEVEGEDLGVQRAVVRDMQYHKVLGNILHLDLLRIDPEERLRVSIPLVTSGTPVGVRTGGALQQSLTTVELECVASELPSSLEIDVSGLDIGDSVHVRELLEQESRILTDPERTILTVLAPRLLTEEEEQAELEAAAEAEAAEAEAAEGEGAEGEEGEGEGAE